MTRRDGTWTVAATLFTLGNAAGAGYAVALGESMHAAGHAAFTVIGVLWVWWLVARTERREALSLPAADEKLERLQQSMDAIALEVERIGESQRFAAKLGERR